MNPWVCPKCGRVWGALVMQCVPCNNIVSGNTTNYPPVGLRRRPPAVTR